MKIGIFTNVIGGHHLEYIHHLYEMAACDVNNKYLFFLPKKFLHIKDHFCWVSYNHIEISLFDEDLDKYTKSYFTQIICSYKTCLLLKRFILQNKCDVLYINTLISILPTAPFVLSLCRCKVIGIIYKIYLYDKMGGIVSMYANKFKYLLLSKSNLFSKVLVLNDPESAQKFNSIYSTNKFEFIPDPYIKLPDDNVTDIRKRYNIGSDIIVFSHIGALSVNKSTIEILKSLQGLSDDERHRYAFIFAGVIHNEIKENFYLLYDLMKSSVKIVLEDKYCSYEELASFCKGSDALLIPYKRTSQSSGIIGYASQFGCPVIAPSYGLLGNLVKKYKLGIMIDDVTTGNLVSAYRRIAKREYVKPTLQYCNDNNVASFQHVIKSCIYQVKC